MRTASRILIVEDQEVLGENLKTYLARSSTDVRLATDAEQALEILKSFTPDVVVLDYGLPDMTGVAAYVEMARRSTHELGCVMITGYPPERVAPRANECGIRHVLTKPFSLSELRTLVDLSAEEACGNPPVPFVRRRETRGAGKRPNLSGRVSFPAAASDGTVVGIEPRYLFQQQRAAYAIGCVRTPNYLRAMTASSTSRSPVICYANPRARLGKGRARRRRWGEAMCWRCARYPIAYSRPGQHRTLCQCRRGSCASNAYPSMELTKP